MKPRLSPWLHALVRHERLVAAMLTAAAVLASLHVLAPAQGRLVPVVVAAHSLSGGAALTRDDLVVVRMPPRLAPDGAIDETSRLVGELIAGPVARGEAVTTTRVLGRALLDALAPGAVAVPVRVADADSVALVRVGDRVDLVVLPADGGHAVQVGVDLPVVTVPPASGSGLADGALIVVAAAQSTAATLAGAVAAGRVAVLVRGR